MEILDFEFFQNALIASLLVSIACGIIGVYVIINRLVFLSGAIAHGAYGGVGIAFFLGFEPLLGAGVFAILLAVIVGFISLKNTQNIDTIIGVIWALGMAIGIIFTDLTPGYNVDLMSYLFGGILGVSKNDIYAMGAICLVIVFTIIIFYRQLQAMSFDKEFAMLRGVKVNFLYFTLLILISLCIVISVRAVGLILVISLLTIPSYIAQIISKQLHFMIINSVLISILFCISGLFISYLTNISSGACIILISACSFFVVFGLSKMITR